MEASQQQGWAGAVWRHPMQRALHRPLALLLVAGIVIGAPLTVPPPDNALRQAQPQCGNRTADLPCEVFLRGNLCDDKGLIGWASGTLGSCFAACDADSSCEYFGVEAAPHNWCIRYNRCVPRTDPAGSSAYTTYVRPQATNKICDCTIVSEIDCL